MKEINFYCIEEDANAFMYQFLSKLIGNGKKVLVYSESPEKMTRLDDMLWNIKKTGFLPHLLVSDRGAEKTPVVISNRKGNVNSANFLLISTFLDDDKFMNGFEKSFYIFSPVGQAMVAEAQKNWNEYKKMGFNTKLMRKGKDGKWVESGEFLIG